MILAVCGGYQLLGRSYQLADEVLPGIGLLDADTVREPGPRLIGNVAIEVELRPRRAPGAGRLREPRRPDIPRSRRGAARPGPKGFGNNGKDGFEGGRAGNVLGTYLHGPLLPKNAWFADWLIETALGLRSLCSRSTTRSSDAAHADARRAAGVPA